MNENGFRIRSRLLEQLGEQLIKDENVAFLELIKNAYDADATKIDILIKDINNPSESKIIIEDNGCGMGLNIIKNIWLEVSTDFKSTIDQTPIYHRHPLGEKGIGRLASQRLGYKTVLISREKDTTSEAFLIIDWSNITQYKYIDEVPVDMGVRAAKTFVGNKTGTKIIISSLKQKWDKIKIEELYRSLNTFINPFNKVPNFEINLIVDDINKDVLTLNELKDSTMYHVDAELEGNRIVKFNYEFVPYSSMNKLYKRSINETDSKISKILNMVNKHNESINLDKYKIGRVKFSAYLLDNENKILKLGLSDADEIREYFDNCGGIKIYRDGIRVYNYGEPENDWLSLNTRHINLPIRNISNNSIFGSIELDRRCSTDLIEDTNREGFIENEAYITFKSAILYLLNVIESQRNIDKEKIKLLYGIKGKSQPVIAPINELKCTIEEKINDNIIKNEINGYLNRIENEYEYINEILFKSASAGLNLSVVIHEIEKIVKELKNITKDSNNERILTLTNHLSSLVEGYVGLIKSSNKRNENIVNIINQAIFNVEFRSKSHNIHIDKKYLEYKGNNQVPVIKNLLLNAIMNIIDNSIWWLDYAKKDQNEEKKLFINIVDKPEGYLSIVIADNGHGFTLTFEDTIKPFVSTKPEGVGLGLHIVDEIIKAHDGIFLFPDDMEIKDYNIPEEYKVGAKLVLSLKR